jgi:hypothetical protein
VETGTIHRKKRAGLLITFVKVGLIFTAQNFPQKVKSVFYFHKKVNGEWSVVSLASLLTTHHSLLTLSLFSLAKNVLNTYLENAVLFTFIKTAETCVIPGMHTYLRRNIIARA